MDKIEKFGNSVVPIKGLIKKNIEDWGLVVEKYWRSEWIYKTWKFRDLIELLMCLIGLKRFNWNNNQVWNSILPKLELENQLTLVWLN